MCRLAGVGATHDVFTKKFNPYSKVSKDDCHYKRFPDANDKVSVLVYVLDASKISLMNQVVLDTILDIRDEANDLEIPQVAILTKIDELCPKIKQDLQNVYKSKILQKMMKEFSSNSGIPMNCIYPVKNYHDEIKLSNDISTLILSILRHIIDDGNEFLDKQNFLGASQS
ncbi:hypothetical protein PAMP_005273 [Pampus punctatissimus]